MAKRLLILLLEFLAGISGNLVAGWIQQDIWGNLFSPVRLVGTLVGVTIMLIMLAWLENMPVLPRLRTHHPQLSVMAQSTAVNPAKNTRGDYRYDAFISYADEDREVLVRPLVEKLEGLGFCIWYDEFSLKVGDSLRRSTDKGLANSKYGVVILSRAFLQKNWPQHQLDGLVARERNGKKVILPVWHNIEDDEVMKYSPSLADRVALDGNKLSVEEIAQSIAIVLQE